jgi:hypothetical protein
VPQVETAPTAQIAKLDVDYVSDASPFIPAAVPSVSKSVPGNSLSTPVRATTRLVTSLAILVRD